MAQEYTPFPNIVEAVQRLCTDQATGSFFIATESNRSAHLMLENGEIVFIYYYNQHGVDALEMMRSIDSGRYKFQKGLITDQRDQLPSTDEILRIMSSFTQEVDLKSTSAGPTVSTVQALSTKQKSVFESCLAEYIGPMAAIICEDHLESAADIQSATDALVTEIPCAEQAKKFREDVMTKLG